MNANIKAILEKDLDGEKTRPCAYNSRLNQLLEK